LKKTIEHYLKLEYPISVRPLIDDEGSGWVAEFNDLDGCIGTGATAEEAIKDALEAKEALIEALFSDNEEVPEPYSSYSGKFPLRMPKSIHRWVDISAKKEGVSANHYINYILSMVKGKNTL